MKLTNQLRDAFVNAVMADVPREDYSQHIEDEVLRAFVAALPPAVRRVWDDPATRAYVHLEPYRGFGISLSVPSFEIDGRWVGLPEGYDSRLLKELEARAAAQESKLEHLRTTLRGVAYSARTRKALADQLPEFEKYLPSEDAPNLYPVALANVATEFMLAGWPKGAKK